jgi:hypothetical protein
MQRIFALIEAERFDLTLMTTHQFGLDDIEKAFRLMQTKEEDIIKPLITLLSPATSAPHAEGDKQCPQPRTSRAFPPRTTTR